MSDFLARFRERFGCHWCLDQRDAEFPDSWICTLPPGHEGDHEGRHVKTGHLFGAWPREA